MEVVVLRPDAYALPPPLMARARAAAALAGGSVRETAERAPALAGAEHRLRQVVVVGGVLRRRRGRDRAARRAPRLVHRPRLVRRRGRGVPLPALPAGASQRGRLRRRPRLATERRRAPGAQPALGADGGAPPPARRGAMNGARRARRARSPRSATRCRTWRSSAARRSWSSWAARRWATRGRSPPWSSRSPRSTISACASCWCTAAGRRRASWRARSACRCAWWPDAG